MKVVTRFAPSPTGFLHIGGARTALFSWLFAKRHNGKFLLRIEDTDRARSSLEAIGAIIDGLDWLGLSSDEPPVYQSRRIDRHKEVALALLDEGKAYKCYATPEELEKMRADQRAAGKPIRYDGRWRDKNPAEAPKDTPYVVRLRSNRDGVTEIYDHVQGPVTISNQQLDDFVLLRADGTPTYMLSVVVDDHDMGITHIIRGDDHLTNAFRQSQLYHAMGWEVPHFAHVPLIHGSDGAKLSKRHGALGVEAYRDMGYLPEALRNYLLRLGWSHGDDEIISTQQAIDWFELSGIGKSPARFDFAKLDNLNAHYIQKKRDVELVKLISPMLEQKLGIGLTEEQGILLAAAMPEIKPRAKRLPDLADLAEFYVTPRPLGLTKKAEKIITDDARSVLGELSGRLGDLAEWKLAPIETCIRDFASEKEIGLGKVAQPFRVAITGSTVSPPIFEAAALLGKDEVCSRINDLLQGRTTILEEAS